MLESAGKKKICQQSHDGVPLINYVAGVQLLSRRLRSADGLIDRKCRKKKYANNHMIV